MNKSVKERSFDELESIQTLSLDDTFEFRCKACGKCCKHREDILLTPYDTFRIAEFLGRTPQEIIKRYCEVYEGNESHFPVVRVLPIPPDNACPFLRERKCSIHTKKPVLCRTYPLARLFETNGSPKYYFNGASCKHESRRITVREWVKDVASVESEKAGRLWMDTISTIYPLINPDKLKLSGETRQMVIKVLIAGLWLQYDMKKPFTSQFEKNFMEIQMFLHTFDEPEEGNEIM